MGAGGGWPLKRWLILGAGGAGKSRLAREMAEILDLPIIHLDRHFWNPGWIESGKKEWARRVVELTSDDEWPDLAEGCEEQLPDLGFVWYVLKYKWRSRPRLLRKIAAEPHVRLYHLKSRGAARRFLGELRDAVHAEGAGEGG